jgi:plasmid stability protein
MARLFIRNLDDAVIERLRVQARLKGVSVEEGAHQSKAAALIREDRDR